MMSGATEPRSTLTRTGYNPVVMDSEGVLIDRSAGTAMVIASGDIDMTMVERFDAALAEALGSRCPDLRVDASDVEFFGSEGVRSLLKAEELARDQGTRLSVVNASRTVRVVLKICDLERLLHPASHTE
jgi:anti-anti-sigma factor